MTEERVGSALKGFFQFQFDLQSLSADFSLPTIDHPLAPHEGYLH